MLLGARMAASMAAGGVSLTFWEPCLPMHQPLSALHVCGHARMVKVADNELHAEVLVLNQARHSHS